MNLVTSATCVTFNPTTEILAVASRDTDEAVKLVCSAFLLQDFSSILLKYCWWRNKIGMKQIQVLEKVLDQPDLDMAKPRHSAFSRI